MGKSAIEWTDETWNPVIGCKRVSEGCRHCYAEQAAFGILRKAKGEPNAYDGTVKLVGGEPRWTGVVKFLPERLAQPLGWKRPRRVFVNSMSDLFHESLSNEEIATVFGVMAAAPKHTFQVLTKRAARMREWFEWLDERIEADAVEWSGRDCATSIDEAREQCRLEYLDETATAALAGHYDVCHLGITTNETIRWPLPNVWLGVSVEDQERADERIPDLLHTPAAVRFLSCEPLLGPVDLTHKAPNRALVGATARRILRDHGGDEETVPAHLRPPSTIDWVIAGCESGPGARDCDVAALLSLLDQCEAAGVSFFAKQWRHVPGVVEAGPDSHRKPGGIIGAPLVRGKARLAFPEVRR